MSNDRMEEIQISKISLSKTNPRKTMDAAKAKELEASIKEKGILQPVVVRPVKGGFELVCGERRTMAAQNVGLKTIPAVIRDLDDKAVLEIQLIENAQRADVHPLEEAEGYEQLMKKHGYANAEEIAAKVGKSKSFVYQRMRLCDLVSECRKMFYAGKLTPSTALLIARLPKDVQKEAAVAITEDKWDGPMNLSDAHDHIQNHFMLDLKDSGFAKDDKICPERGSCTTCLKRTGNQDALFPDIKDGDRCTDAACFNAKRAALVQRSIEKAKKTGFEVIPTKDVFEHGCHVSSGYVDMKDKCYRDEKNRAYKDILKSSKTFRVSLAVDPNGVIREVAKESDVKKAMKDVGFKSQYESSSSGPSVADQRREKELRDIIHGKIMDEIMRMVKIDLNQHFWPTLASASVWRLYEDEMSLMARRIKPGTKRNDARGVILEHVKGLDNEGAKMFVIEAFLASRVSEAHADLSKMYKVNEKAIEKQVTAEMAPKAKAKK